MKAFAGCVVFDVRDHARDTLFAADETKDAESALLQTLSDAGPGTLLVVDFSKVRIASAPARTLLSRALKRLTSGELADRFLVLQNLGESEYNVDVMLAGESLAAVERTEDRGPQLRGKVDPAVSDTYRFLLSIDEGTAGAVRDHFRLENTSTATNRLATLARLGLARRTGMRPASGGGREYVYAAVR